MPLLTVADYEAAQRIVYGAMPPTPQYAWPLLAQRVGTEVWVKHENHTPTGAFKVRGGLVYMDRLKRERPQVRGVISATRGNHGQSVAFAARRNGVRAVILVPHGNSVEKNAAMRAFGAELIEHGHDFDSAREEAARIAPERGLEMLPSFNMDLVRGVGTYAMELFKAAPDLDTVYAPIGLGSGICGLITARDALGLKTKIVGCVSTNAPTYALSFAAKKPIETNSADTFADGVAVRVPSPEALDIIVKGAERIVQVSDAEVEAAMCAYYVDTHQLAEGAGAVPLAGLMQERERMRGRKVAVILSGGNIDRPVYARIIAQDRASAPTPGRS